MITSLVHGSVFHFSSITARFAQFVAFVCVLQQQQDPNQWNAAGYYSYGQGYENYGYAPQAQQNANMFAYGGYPGYGNYQQPQQQPQQQV